MSWSLDTTGQRASSNTSLLPAATQWPSYTSVHATGHLVCISSVIFSNWPRYSGACRSKWYVFFLRSSSVTTALSALRASGSSLSMLTALSPIALPWRRPEWACAPEKQRSFDDDGLFGTRVGGLANLVLLVVRHHFVDRRS